MGLFFRQAAALERRETSLRRGSERLESPVAGILLGNYEVIGEVPEKGDTPRGITFNNVQ